MRIHEPRLCLVDKVTSNEYRSKILASVGLEPGTMCFPTRRSTSRPRRMGREDGLLGCLYMLCVRNLDIALYITMDILRFFN